MVPPNGSWDSEALNVFLVVDADSPHLLSVFYAYKKNIYVILGLVRRNLNCFDYILGISFIGLFH